MIAVVLGEAIWAFLVSIVNNVALPVVAKLIGGNSQLFFNVGKADFDFPALFISILELGLAMIVALIVNSWSNKLQGRAEKPILLPKLESPNPKPIAAPAAKPPSAASIGVAAPIDVSAKPLQSEVQPERQQAQSLKAPKSKKAKEVYYNIVGEPLDRED